MADYTYHGDGSVTVSQTKHQTGGAGVGSTATYSNEAAARSAVSANTISQDADVQKQISEGAVATKEQLSEFQSRGLKIEAAKSEAAAVQKISVPSYIRPTESILGWQQKYGAGPVATPAQIKKLELDYAYAQAQKRQEKVSSYYSSWKKRSAEKYEEMDLGVATPLKRIPQGVGEFSLGMAEMAHTVRNIGQTAYETKGDILGRMYKAAPRAIAETPKQLLWSVQEPFFKYGTVGGGMYNLGQLGSMAVLAKGTARTRVPAPKRLITAKRTGAPTTFSKMFGVSKPKGTTLKVTSPEGIGVRGKWTPAAAEKAALRYLIKKKPSEPKPQIWVDLKAKPKVPLSQKMFGKGTLKPISNILSNIKKTPSILVAGAVSASKNIPKKMFGMPRPKVTVLKITSPKDISIVKKWTPAAAEKAALRYIVSKKPPKPKPQIWISPKKLPKVPVGEKVFGKGTLRPIANIVKNIKRTPSILATSIKKSVSKKNKLFGTAKAKTKPTILKITRAEDISIVKKWTPASAEKAALRYLIKKKPSEPKPQIWVDLKAKPKVPLSQKMFGSRKYKKPKKPLVIPGLLYSPIRTKPKPIPPQLELIYEPIQPTKSSLTPSGIPKIFMPIVRDIGKTTISKGKYPSKPKGVYIPIKADQTRSSIPLIIRLPKTTPRTRYTPSELQIPKQIISLIPKTAVKQAVKQAAIQKTSLIPKTIFRPMQDRIIQPIPKRRTPQLLKLKRARKPKRGTYKFKEITGVMLPSQMFRKREKFTLFGKGGKSAPKPKPKTRSKYRAPPKSRSKSSVLMFREWKM